MEGYKQANNILLCGGSILDWSSADRRNLLVMAFSAQLQHANFFCMW